MDGAHFKQGADPGFSFGGGGAQKIMCPHAHYERGTDGAGGGSRIFIGGGGAKDYVPARTLRARNRRNSLSAGVRALEAL